MYEAKFQAGEEVDFNTLKTIGGIRADEISREYTVEDIRGRIFRRKVIELDRLQSSFGADCWKVKETLKIFMTMSSYLPEVYYASMIDRNLIIYMTHFE